MSCPWAALAANAGSTGATPAQAVRGATVQARDNSQTPGLVTFASSVSRYPLRDVGVRVSRHSCGQRGHCSRGRTSMLAPLSAGWPRMSTKCRRATKMPRPQSARVRAGFALHDRRHGQRDAQHSRDDHRQRHSQSFEHVKPLCVIVYEQPSRPQDPTGDASCRHGSACAKCARTTAPSQIQKSAIYARHLRRDAFDPGRMDN